jgi:dipeptidyl aminopeptidase/acylaminoacyl peptidase
LRLTYEGGPGRIADVQAQDSPPTIFEEAVDLANWPARSRWGRLESVEHAGQHTFQEPFLLEGAVFRADGRARFFHQEPADSSRNRLALVDLAAGRTEYIQPPGMAATWASVSADGRTVSAILESLTQSPEIYVWTTATRQWRKITNFRPNLPPVSLADQEWITWRSGDDRFDLAGILVKPRNFQQGRRYPLIVELQGGTPADHAMVQNRYNPGLRNGGTPAAVLAARGYLVLYPNHRGVGNYGPAFTQAFMGHGGEVIRYDVEAGVNALVARGLVDPERVAIAGWSGGGWPLLYAISPSASRRRWPPGAHTRAAPVPVSGQRL